MAKKPNALDAQLMTLRQCMAICAVDMTQETWRKGRWVALALAVLTGLVYSWSSIFLGIKTAILAVWSAILYLNLGVLFKFIGLTFVTIFFTPVYYTYKFVDYITYWATPFLHTSRLCETHGDGEAAEIICTFADAPLNFIALGAAGSIAILLNAIWFMGMLYVFACLKHKFDYGYSNWTNKAKELIESYIEVMPQLSLVWFIGCIFAGIMGNFIMPLVWDSFARTETVISAFLLVFPLALTAVPLLWLSSQLDKNMRETKAELRDKLDSRFHEDIRYKNDIHNLYDSIKDSIINLSEDNKAWISRIFVFFVAGCVFLAACQFGYTVAPDGWKAYGFFAGAIVSLIALSIFLAGLVTCYVQVRSQVQDINQKIMNAELPKLETEQENFFS